MVGDHVSSAEMAPNISEEMPLNGSAPRRSLLTPAPVTEAQCPAVHSVLLSPGGTLVGEEMRLEQDTKRKGNLAVAIRQRIEARTGGRIRDLAVRVSGNTVVLEGRCATYYSKQLAQHAALGVIEDENLENDIVVAMSQ
jgi:hypothetical protein